MPYEEHFTAVRVPRTLRVKLKLLAARHDQKMYAMLETLVDTALKDDTAHSHSPEKESPNVRGSSELQLANA